MLRYVALLTALSGSQAAAADWWLVGSTGSGNDESAYFVDQESVTSRLGTKKRFWVFAIHEALQDGGVRKVKTHWETSCSERTTALISVVKYGNNDTYKGSVDIPNYEQVHQAVVPESIAEGYMNFVCSGPQKGNLQIAPLSPERVAVILFKD